MLTYAAAFASLFRPFGFLELFLRSLRLILFSLLARDPVFLPSIWPHLHMDAFVLFHEISQSARVCGVAKSLERLSFDLAHSFAGHSQLFAYLLKCVRLAAHQSIA